MNTKHTPGPWTAKHLGADGIVIHRPGWEITTPEYDVVANILRGAPIRNEADALLIASAPDLLAALQRLTEDINDTDAIHVARAAIRKATGAEKE